MLSSAGGLTLLLHGDRIRRFFPSTAVVKAVIDAGLFIDVCDHDSYANTSGAADVSASQPDNVVEGDRDPSSWNGHTFRKQ